MDLTTTRRSKRIIEAKIKHPTDPFKNKRVKTQEIIPSEGISGISAIKDDSHALIESCLQRMPQGIWYRINPYGTKETNNIHFAIG